jgi:CRISPR/Cas system-associated endonuclease Cas1
MKKIVVIKEYKKVLIFSNYMELKGQNGDFIIGYEHIKELYILQDINIPIKYLLKIIKKFPIYFINSDGYILARLCEVKDEE